MPHKSKVLYKQLEALVTLNLLTTRSLNNDNNFVEVLGLRN